MQKIIHSMKGNGVADKDIQSTSSASSPSTTTPTASRS